MPREQKTIHLFGDFRNAQVDIGNGGFIFGRSKRIDPGAFDKPYHDEVFNRNKYRFVNPEKAPEALSVDTFKHDKNSYVFEGDLDGLFVEVTSGGVRAQHFEDRKGANPPAKPEEPSSPG